MENYTMAIEKKSLISSRTAAKKAVVARESGNQVTAGTTKVAPIKRVPMRVALKKAAPSKAAPARFAPSKAAPVRFAPSKAAPARFAPMKKI
jgi:hypothetical protein